MNTNATAMSDDAILAFSRPAPVTPPAPRRRRWPRVLLALTLIGLLATLSLGALVWSEAQGHHGLAEMGDWHVGFGPDGWRNDLGPGQVVKVGLAVTLALAIVAVVVPTVLLGVGLAVGLSLALTAVAMLAALGLVLGMAALVLAVATSPLWLIGALLWWALRPRRRAVASGAAF